MTAAMLRRKREAGRRWTAWEAGFLYHVTLAKHLPSIAAHGLRPGRGGISGKSTELREHSSGKVFVAPWHGVLFWADSATDLASTLARGDACEEELVPVILRVAANLCIRPDQFGWRDSRVDAYEVGNIPPEDLQLFEGRHTNAWIPAARYHELDLASACVVAEEMDRPKFRAAARRARIGTRTARRPGRREVMLLGPEDNPLLPELPKRLDL